MNYFNNTAICNALNITDPLIIGNVNALLEELTNDFWIIGIKYSDNYISERYKLETYKNGRSFFKIFGTKVISSVAIKSFDDSSYLKILVNDIDYRAYEKYSPNLNLLKFEVVTKEFIYPPFYLQVIAEQGYGTLSELPQIFTTLATNIALEYYQSYTQEKSGIAGKLSQTSIGDTSFTYSNNNSSNAMSLKDKNKQMFDEIIIKYT